MNPQERFDRFISLFSEGRYLSALQHLFHRPHVPLESYGAHERYLRPILNFADALAYESPHDAFVLAKQLQIDLDAEPRFLLDDSAFLDRIQGLLPLLACASGAVPVEKGRRAYDELDPEDLYFFDAVTSNTPNASEAGQLVRHRHHLLRFREAYPELSQALDFAYIPLFPLRFDPPSKPSYHIPLSEGVCIWAEPYAIDWSALRRDVGSRPTILAFQNKAALVHCLQFPEVLDWLLDPQTWPWVLNAYLYDHGSTLPPACSYSSITVSQNHWIVENSELLLAQLCSAVRSFHPLEKEDSAEADLLYDSGKRLAFVSESERLGQCRHLAHWMREAQRDFFDDPHTRRPAKPALLNTPLPDHLGQVLSAAHPLFPKRPKHKRERYRVAHLFRILLDTSHAPTKILRTLLSRLDKDCFEQSLYTLENGLLRPREYPLHTVTAKISEETGPRTLALAAEHGVHCRSFANQQDDYNDLSARVCQALHEDEIDLVIHHYTPSVALLINRRSDCPCEIVFNHGGPDILPDPSGFALPAYNALPTHPGFDLIIESEKRTTEALAFYDSIGSHVVNLGFVIDHNLEQTEKPVERSCLGVNADTRILTTVSHFLHTRLSREYCWAVAQILQRSPKAVFMPIGSNDPNAKYHRYFEEFGVADKVRYLGLRENPRSYLAIMDLYLNEFPAGSCVALIEAMGVGLPIVSMYDPNGSPQGRYGGMFLGTERTVNSLKKEDYADLAIRLLQDPLLHRQWSSDMRELYRQRTDVDTYIKNFETLLREQMEERHPS